MNTRAEHMRWCKKRALEYLDVMQPPDHVQALTSMMSDLSKHPETKGIGDNLGPIALFEMMNGNVESARRFITGFAE